MRLETIGPPSYWRNVFLFAVGKCFVEREHMLDSIVSLCAGLNEEVIASRILGDEIAGRAARFVSWGSRLALDILVDGTARQYPEYELRLVKIALELLKSGDTEAHARLAAVYHPELGDSYCASLSDRLGQSNFWLQLGGWQLLMGLADRGITWASMNSTGTGQALLNNNGRYYPIVAQLDGVCGDQKNGGISHPKSRLTTVFRQR